jgi:hypothetical protein
LITIFLMMRKPLSYLLLPLFFDVSCLFRQWTEAIAAISPQTIQDVNQLVSSLNDTLGEATTVRIDPDQRYNSTTWALVFAEILCLTWKVSKKLAAA